MKKRILMSGGSGGLGKEFIKQNDKFEIIAPTSFEMDVQEMGELDNGFCYEEPDIYIHCAAMSSPMKNHETSPSDSIDMNIVATARAAQACLEWNVKMVYISTDFVYPGYTSYHEECDAILPVNRYAWSKLGGECAVRMIPDDQYLIFRCAFIDKPYPHKKALTDAYKSLIYVDKAAQLMLDLIDKGVCGVFNIGGDYTSYCDFAKKDNPSIEGIKREELDEFMPFNSSMNIWKMRNETKQYR